MGERLDTPSPKTVATNGSAEIDTVDAAVARWQSHLLQLNRSNNLLYFKGNTAPKDPKSGRRATIRCVPISRFNPDGIDDYLQRARRGRTFDYARRRRRRRGTALEPATSEPVEADADIEFVPGDLTTDVEPLALQRVLLRFLRKEREWMEEQGINVLFLAAGFLEWIDEDRERAKAPLLLLPVDLQRSSPREPFVLRREDDDATANATLRHKLRQFEITLPEFDHETYAAYLNEVSDLVSGRDGWRVTQEVVLSTFQYTKLAMWEDLEQMRTVGVTHPLVRRLAGEEVTLDSSGTAARDAFPPDSELAGGQLDDMLDLRQEVTVLAVDHSQLRAVAAARAGDNLVIHGPPGTGKSQTIVNIISNLLTHGKRVLFVSEKSVALDVVKDRLDQENLGVFCLDMHSDRASKTSVYEQLRSSIEDNGEVSQIDYNYADLESSRNSLNVVVRGLHETREPLGRSVYDIHGEYASVRDLPDVEFPVPSAVSITEPQIREVTSLADRIARRDQEFRDLATTKWKPLKVQGGSVGLADQLRRDADTALRVVERAERLLSNQAGLLCVPAPEDMAGASSLRALACHLENRPRTLPHWLQRDVLKALRRIAAEQREQQQQALELSTHGLRAFGGRVPTADFRHLSRSVRPSTSEIEALREALGSNWAERLLPDPAAIFEDATRLQTAAIGLNAALDELAAQFGIDSPAASWLESSRVLGFASQLVEVAAVPNAWIDLDQLVRVRQLAAAARKTHQALTSAESEFFASFDPELVDDVNREMLVRFRIDHQSGIRRHLIGRATYQSDLRLLRGHSRVPGRMDVAGWLSVVERAISIQSLRRDWESAYAAVEPHIGQHARSLETDWVQLEALMDRLERLLQSWPWRPDRLRMLLTNHVDRQALHDPQQTAQMNLEAVEDSLQLLKSDRLDLKQIGPGGILANIQQALAPLERLADATQSIVRQLADAPADWLAFCELIDDLARLQTIEEYERSSRGDLRRDFGEWFNGRDTDWDAVLGALLWCQKLLDLLDNKPSDRLCEIVCSENLALDPMQIAGKVESVQASYPSDLAVLDSRFQHSDSPWTSWEAAPFRALGDWLASVRQDADSATSWNEFKLAADELDRILGADSVARIRDATDDATLVPGIVNRRLYATWLDAISQQDPRLRDFTGRDHEALRRRFQNLDLQLPNALRDQARTVLFGKYPKSRTGFTRSGQLGVLRGELTKRRRQMSVRQLLTTAPHLIQVMKPCFLMSPLAVSQYLARTGSASANLHFDTVVFDEASQVLPEDAVPAISRTNQTIVVGDRRQLPPTTLFQHRYEHEDDDDDGDEETDWFEGRESILDVMVGMVGSGVAEHYLGVHYRSRHDSLIRYSNHYFYDDRLLTFPSPRKPAAHGVQAVYLPDGRYESGGSRTNRREAERVVELVFELLRTRPKSESIGVVTLSRAQADLIETLIDEAREFHPEYEDRFARERQERFFVKNLENVQGDERDHILLSVCYGPTESGQIYNRFGPINNEGGERRLNVAVSRARRSMTIVHSLKPEDITSESRGARLLKRYLEFARSPDSALGQAAADNGQAKTESPFEESVRRALVERGHRVATQVGVAGYRVDLAIQAEDGAGYALGIECDGATYHSAPAARDRDWLRQSVLEGLGWRIHRVWSRAWIQNPERELDAIEHALNEGETFITDTDAPLRPVDEKSIVSATTLAKTVAVVDEDSADESPDDVQGSEAIEEDEPSRVTVVSGEDWMSRDSDNSQLRSLDSEGESGSESPFGTYVVADLSQIWIGEALRGEDFETLEELILTVVQDEGPVHVDAVVERIRIRYGVGRVQRSTRAQVYQAVTSVSGLKWLGSELGGATLPDSFLATLDHGSSGLSMNPLDAQTSSPFLVLPGQSIELRPRAPNASAPRNHASRRKIDHIPLLEIKSGVLVCANLLYGAGRTDLVKETARQFGFRRTGKGILKRIGQAVDELVHDGKLTGDDKMLTAAAPG